VLYCRIGGVEVCQKVYKRACFVSDEQFGIIRHHVLLGNEMSYVPRKNRTLVSYTDPKTLSTVSKGLYRTMKQTDIRSFFKTNVRVDFDN
jgi:hypothetical protein